MNDQTPITTWQSLTPEQKGAAIRPLILVEQLSYGQIARRFGTTRSAIASAADRHNIISPLAMDAQGRGAKGGRVYALRNPATPRPERPRKSRVAPTQPAGFPADDFIDKTPLRKDAWTALPGTAPRAVEHHKRDEHECCWPIGEDPILFCCAPALPGGQYCERHNALAFRPRPEVRKGTTS